MIKRKQYQSIPYQNSNTNDLIGIRGAIGAWFGSWLNVGIFLLTVKIVELSAKNVQLNALNVELNTKNVDNNKHNRENSENILNQLIQINEKLSKY